MPLLFDLLLAFAAGVAAALATRWFAITLTARPALETARKAGEVVRPHPRLRRFLAARLDRSVTTGFLLTVALGFALAAGVVLGVLAYLIRALPALQRIDNAAASWGFHHRTAWSTDGLRAITDLGGTQVVIALAFVLIGVDFARTRDRWSAPFLLIVMGGIELLTLAVKDLAGRVRPALDPIAATLGPSFPSGHSATSAAFYAAAALIVGRRAAARYRHLLAASAVATAVAVAASRVLLDLHWLSDVIGGLSLGWGWFALCAVIFGGRLLRPRAALDTATAAAYGTPATPTPAGAIARPGSPGQGRRAP